MDYSPWDCKELNMTERLSLSLSTVPATEVGVFLGCVCILIFSIFVMVKYTYKKICINFKQKVTKMVFYFLNCGVTDI